ncbi:hypothetical protein [Desertivibrio insolitus]|uniref:hypothetical protein n=1 Tax=Herbiconiux sp. SYSU D00978 TaxID=2812562 RepID=UPI001A96525D|nr:hypothetical protein [Herbiconiux sp. SYSU D00978]
MTETRFDPRYPRIYQRGCVPPPRDPRIALTSPIDVDAIVRRSVRLRDPRIALTSPVSVRAVSTEPLD